MDIWLQRMTDSDIMIMWHEIMRRSVVVYNNKMFIGCISLVIGAKG